jgi:hypothetical protein
LSTASIKIRINLHPGVVLHSAVSQVKPKRVAAVVNCPIITSVTDLKTGSVNGTLTPGRDVKISGTKLKIAGDHSDVGIYFVHTGGGAEVKVDPSDIVVNNPSEVIAVIPLALRRNLPCAAGNAVHTRRQITQGPS